MLSAATTAEITALARKAGLDPAALLAVVEVESGGQVFARIGGRQEPLIRFEGHYFDRRLSGAARDRARREGLAAPTAGTVKNPAAQAARWALLERARAIDPRAADESTSWGVGQVMGAHWAWLGYASVAALVAEARKGLPGQVALMLRFIEQSGLRPALKRRDWAIFARGYNGPAYAKNAYDRKIAAAFARHSGAAAPQLPARGHLRKGSRGERVADLQRGLTARGYPLVVDGLFGPATEAAVRAFQQASGLAPDGIVGPATGAALEAADVAGISWLGLLLTLLGRLAGRRR